MKRILQCCLLTTALVSCAVQAAGEVEVLNWWTSGGEAKSLAVLKQMIEKQGFKWKSFAVPGGGGESAMTVLKARAISGNPPTAAQIKGHDIQEWASLGFLTNLDSVAKEQHWDQILPRVVANVMKYHGHYVAVPVNVHRVNWLWANPKIFKALKLQIPQTWPEFFKAAAKIKAAGYIPLALNNQDWQNANLFESMALSILGSKDYIKAFVDNDPKTLSSTKMVKVFRQFKRIHQYLDPRAAGLTWNAETDLVIHGKAAMQIMGDWVKGEFLDAHQRPGKDFVCVPSPGTQGEFIFDIDSFAMFQLTNPDDIAAQHALAHTIMSTKFQEIFNLNKGSIPVRIDMDMSKFDQCALRSMHAFKTSAQSGQLVPSIANSMATTSYVQTAIFDVVNDFFNNPKETAKHAAMRLARSIQAAS